MRDGGGRAAICYGSGPVVGWRRRRGPVARRLQRTTVRTRPRSELDRASRDAFGYRGGFEFGGDLGVGRHGQAERRVFVGVGVEVEQLGRFVVVADQLHAVLADDSPAADARIGIAAVRALMLEDKVSAFFL